MTIKWTAEIEQRFTEIRRLSGSVKFKIESENKRHKVVIKANY